MDYETRQGRGRAKLSVIGIGMMISAVILLINVAIFNNYEQNLIALQKDNLLTIAKAVASNIENFYESSLDTFSLFFSSANTKRQAEEYYLKQNDGISAMYLLSADGEILDSWGLDYQACLEDFLRENPLPFKGQAGLARQTLVDDNRFVQFLYTGTQLDGEKVYIAAAIETEYVYQKIVRPIKIGQNGYSMVKDIGGTIVMHNAKSQIGLDAVEGRRELYREYNLDLTDLEEWIDEQKNNQEGTRILESYWWDDPTIPPSEKVVVFTKIGVGDDIWIVNSTLDYQELAEPITRTLNMVIGVSVSTIALFAMLIYQVINHMNIAGNMRMEITYLNELNSALEELKRSNEILRHNDKLKTIGTMTGMIAHEFNNYLTPIQLYCDMILLDESVGEETKAYVAEILEASKGAAELTKELSIYGRRDKGLQRMVVIPLKEQINRSLSIVRKMLPTNVELKISLEEGEVFVRGNKGMANQVVVNLCTNAIHAMAGSGGVLTITGKRIPGAGLGGYELCVSDTGTGMNEDVQQQIFQPFYTTKQAGSGTGLGLSIIQQLVQQAGGSIQVFSRLGEGSRFVIQLPLVDPKQEEVVQETGTTNKTLRILVVEDKKSVGRAIEKALLECYKKTTLFSNPANALAAVKESPESWDVILTDYNMPVLSGLEFSSILRNLGVKAKIILMSGNLDADVQWYVDNGVVDAVLEKPVSLQRFEAALDEAHNKYPKS